MSEAKLRAKNPIVVVKIGTSSLMREACRGPAIGNESVSEQVSLNLKNGQTELAVSTIGLLIDTLIALRRANYDVILVTSGGVGVGCREMNVPRRPTVPDGATRHDRARVLASIQAFAAIGQSVLMRTYDSLFSMAGQKIAQVLLTSGDLGSEYQYYNAKNTLLSLLSMGVIPVINENDTTATEEIKYGDNDWLSALVATTMGASWLFLLTDVDQLYTANPRTDPSATPISVVENIEAMHVTLDDSNNATGTQWGTGGMKTKITAARLATAAGVRVCLVHGQHPSRVLDFVQDRRDKTGTVFEPLSTTPLAMERKKWITNCLPPRGEIVISDAAAALLRAGHPLRAKGVVGCNGEFEENSAVSIRMLNGLEVGRGLSNYSSKDVNQFKGMYSNEILNELGFPKTEKVVHEDNLGLLVDMDTDSTDSAGEDEEVTELKHADDPTCMNGNGSVHANGNDSVHANGTDALHANGNSSL